MGFRGIGTALHMVRHGLQIMHSSDRYLRLTRTARQCLILELSRPSPPPSKCRTGWMA